MSPTPPAAIQRQPLPGPKKRRRSACSLLFLAGLVVFVCLVLALAVAGLAELTGRTEDLFGSPAPGLSFTRQARLSAQLLLARNELLEPGNLRGEPRPFSIALGESPLAIAARLQEWGLIPDAGAFVVFLQYSDLDTTLQAGEYTLSPAVPPVEIARALQDATPKEVTLSILPGWRLEEVAGTIPTTGLEFSQEEFLSEVQAPVGALPIEADLPPGATLEGLLHPGSYRLPRQSSLEQVIGTLMEAFSASITSDLAVGFEQQGLSLYEAVTLASLVEREAIVDDEMPLIASVLLNRLAAGMRLEVDSSVQYARGFNQAQNTWWTNPLSSQDLEIDSPYNTYRSAGLPPGPIASPGDNALQAVAYPASTPYYYFRAACDGSGKHTFAETYEQHLGNACP